LVGPVLAELLQGMRNAKETDLLKTLLTTLPYLEIDRQDWHAAGQILQELRSRGVTIPLTDALIGMVAKRHDLRLLTIDRHFEHLPAQPHLFPWFLYSSGKTVFFSLYISLPITIPKRMPLADPRQ